MNDIYKNKIVLVTGASRGIGEAIANKFALLGAHVIGTGTTTESAQRITDKFVDKNLSGTGLVLNISEKKSVETFAKIIQEMDAPSILINNAGVT